MQTEKNNLNEAVNGFVQWDKIAFSGGLVVLAIFSFLFLTEKTSLLERKENYSWQKQAQLVESEEELEKQKFSSQENRSPEEINDKKNGEEEGLQKTVEDQEQKQSDKKSNLEENYSSSKWDWLENQPKLYQLEDVEVDQVLEEIHERFSEPSEKLKAFSILRLGTPYGWGGLGEEKGRDKDPVFRVDVADCTSFVLTNVALLHGDSISKAREIMVDLNYHPEGSVSFTDRLHFTTDRNNLSPYFADITKEVAGEGRTKEEVAKLNKVEDDGERLIDIDWEKEVVVRYIPSQHLTPELLSNFPEVCGVAFLRESNFARGLDVSHEGFLFNGDTLFHASSSKERIVKEKFLDYYFGKDASFDGIIVFEVK